MKTKREAVFTLRLLRSDLQRLQASAARAMVSCNHHILTLLGCDTSRRLRAPGGAEVVDLRQLTLPRMGAVMVHAQHKTARALRASKTKTPPRARPGKGGSKSARKRGRK